MFTATISMTRKIRLGLFSFPPITILIKIIHPTLEETCSPIKHVRAPPHPSLTQHTQGWWYQEVLDPGFEGPLI